MNPAHSLVVVFDQEWLANVHPFPINSTASFDFLDWIYIDANLVGDNADNIVIILPHNLWSIVCVTCVVKCPSWCLFHFLY